MGVFSRLKVVGLAAALGVSGCATTPSLHGEMVDLRATPAAPLTADGRPTQLTWEVLNRNRLLIDGEQARFEEDLAAYIEAYSRWHRREETIGRFPNILDADLLHDNKTDDPLNYAVNYDPGTGSYRCHDADASAVCRSGPDWIEDAGRQVRLTFGEAADVCTWSIDGVRDAVTSCVREMGVDIDVPRMVAVRRARDGRMDQTVVQVRDLRIVALGDSFSAGEGNPHVQWRRGRHPAAWLDQRCHRSLISGPHLTAAWLARTRPHQSVTLLHYGCSGASIADGLVTPWAQLETTEAVRQRFEAFDIEGDRFTRARVATVDPALHDVPRAQIDQAIRDLTVNGELQRPDLILISIGGNDIGFASIVEALAVPSETDPDLEVDRDRTGLERVRDPRTYASFDQANWVQASRNVPCTGLDRVECMRRRVADRISGPGADRATLMNQYSVLNKALAPLTGGDDGRVFMTHYPNFVMREPDGVAPDRAHPDQAEGCHDRSGDGRPGFLPGVVGDLRSFGMKREDSEIAEAAFLKPLNGAIDEAAEIAGWNVVRSHVQAARTHGYCSYHRYYNTLADSYWNQGRLYATSRPLGNLVMLQRDNPFGLPVGTRVVWNADDRCFVVHGDTEARCLPDPATLPVVQQSRDGADAVADTPHTWGTSGPVHPNLFGHCNYAAAIVGEVAASRPDLLEGDRVVVAGPRPRPALMVCDSAAWGHVHWPQRAGSPPGQARFDQQDEAR